ncbi:TPA: hypothetical protein VB825_001070 [Streptococcus suis]|nr:hypothetical protein [Streptococcus suis]
MFEDEVKKLKVDDLRKMQETFDSKNHKEKIEVSIDRLTLLVDANNTIFLIGDLRNALMEELEGQAEYSIRSSDYKNFSLEYVTEDGETVNLIYFEISMKGEILLRLDFNPNSLKEYGAMDLWRKIIVFLTLQSEEIRLSRFDLAFDIFNLPSIITV